MWKQPPAFIYFKKIKSHKFLDFYCHRLIRQRKNTGKNLVSRYATLLTPGLKRYCWYLKTLKKDKSWTGMTKQNTTLPRFQP